MCECVWEVRPKAVEQFSFPQHRKEVGRGGEENCSALLIASEDAFEVVCVLRAGSGLCRVCVGSGIRSDVNGYLPT